MSGVDPVRRRFRPAVAVGRATVRQLLRKQFGSALPFGVVAGFNVLLGLVLVGAVGTGAYDLGTWLAAGDPAAAEGVRGAALSGLVLVGVMQTLGAASDARHKHHRVAFLAATSTGAVVAALLARRVVAALVLFGPAMLAAAVAFAVGAGAPASAVSLGLGSLWLVAATAVWTLPLGLAANWVLAGYDLSGTARLWLGAAVLGGFYLLLFARGAVVATLAGTPLAWAGDLLLATVRGGGADPARAGAFAVASAAAVAVAGLACVRLAAAVWYADPAVRDGGDEAGTGHLPGFGTGPLCAVCGPRTAALVAVTWRRTRRTPTVLFYVYPSALVGIAIAERLVWHGPFSPALYPAVAGFAGAAAVGSGFTLNPLGTEGDALPWVLSSGAGHARLVRAKALAAGLPGGAAVVALVAALGTGAGRVPAVVLVAALAYAAALVALATLLSQALGVHYPPDHEGLLGGSVKVPDKSASALYSAGMVLVGVPGFAGLGQYALAGTLAPVALAAGVGVTVVAALALAALSYRHAVGELAAYSVE